MSVSVVLRTCFGVVATTAAVLVLAEVSVADVGGRDPHNPQLRPVAADIHRVRSLLLTIADLPRGFHIYRPYTDQLPKFTGTCGKLADPDLSALTETANVSEQVLANTDSGAEYLPPAYVFASRAQAARA